MYVHCHSVYAVLFLSAIKYCSLIWHYFSRPTCEKHNKLKWRSRQDWIEVLVSQNGGDNAVDLDAARAVGSSEEKNRGSGGSATEADRSPHCGALVQQRLGNVESNTSEM